MMLTLQKENEKDHEIVVEVDPRNVNVAVVLRKSVVADRRKDDVEGELNKIFC